ncbi:MAG: macro domain-containing protein [Bacteroidetes bacterium]|nr:macro domain-containing protein [Bacteroidota bacterium]MBI3481492.1 macro domain-containing protein [Bacteroidota bacterium]
MISYKQGNILDAPAEALVNTVNTVGVMGKGIALQFRNAFPENYKAYLDAVKEKKIQLGKVQVVRVHDLKGVNYVINFPTKAHWRYPSRVNWIESGLQDLRQQIISFNIKSIAVPPLGCGNGGLDWNEVRPIIENSLRDLSIDVMIYEPSEAIREALKQEDRPKAAHLTPVRAMLLQLLYQYRSLGEFASEFAAEKLSYFLQRFGETQMKLEFVKGTYGPYSGKVRHVLYAMNGFYLKGYEQKDAGPFEALELVSTKKKNVAEFLNEKTSSTEKERLKKVTSLIEGFESAYGLELLATVDFLMVEQKTRNEEVIQKLLWSQRKADLFSKEHIQLAVSHLMNYKSDLYKMELAA